MLKGRVALAACISVYLSLVTESICQLSARNGDGRTKYPKTSGSSTIRRFIEDNGMIYENHSVTTEDGWILNLNRMINPKIEGKDRGYPLLLVNGYFMHSEAWLVQPEIDSNIAIQWSKEGYDVWLGDQRGTMRSRRHVNLTEKDAKYWDYSFQETGMYDIAAFIDYILLKTGYKDTIFTCISLGCSFHAVLISTRPEYNEKIRAAVYFVPVLNNVRNPRDWGPYMFTLFEGFLSLLIPDEDYIAVESLGSYEKSGGQDMLPNIGLVRKEGFQVCKAVERILQYGLLVVFGPYIHLPPKFLCEMLLLSVGGTNVKSTRHLLQVAETGDFAQYDYGREENKKRYGTELPPLYEISKITSFLAIYYSDKDMFLSVEGVQKTLRSVRGPTYSCMMPNFNHLDVAAGSTFHYVLPDVIDLLGALTGNKNNTDKLESGKCPSLEWIRNRRS